MSRKSLVMGGQCIHGHTLTEQNVYRYPNGKIVCKICRRVSFRKSQGLPPADPNEPIENWARDKDRKKSHCPQGHPYNDENTRLTSTGRRCKTCDYERNREKQYREKYGITVEQFENMAEQQSNHCAICGNEATETLHVDHDHTTGLVRELLCTNCNNGLGRFFDNPDLLIAATNYIIKHKQ